MSKSKMSVRYGITQDRARVWIALLQDDRQLGWIEFTGEHCDEFLTQVAKWRAMLTDVLPWQIPPTNDTHAIESVSKPQTPHAKNGHGPHSA